MSLQPGSFVRFTPGDLSAATPLELAEKVLGPIRVLAYTKGEGWWEDANAALQEMLDRLEKQAASSDGEDAQATIGTGS